MPYLGEIRMFAGSAPPTGWALCDGLPLSVSEYSALFDYLGATWGGNGTTTFNLPDLRGRVPVGAGHGTGLSPRSVGDTGGSEAVFLSADQIPAHNHTVLATSSPATTDTPGPQVILAALPDSATDYALYPPTPSNPSKLNANAVGMVGLSAGHDNMMPSLAVNFIICLTDGLAPTGPMSDEPFVGEIRLFGFNFPPRDWAACAGQLISRAQNPPLAAVIGDTFGGTVSAFNLPDLGMQAMLGYAAMGAGAGPSLTPRPQQQAPVGENAVTLQTNQMPPHYHDFATQIVMPNTTGNLLVASPSNAHLVRGIVDNSNTHPYNIYGDYTSDNQVKLRDPATGVAGGQQPHDNMQPCLGLNFCICTSGHFPTSG